MSNRSLQQIKVGSKPLYRPRSDRILFGVCSGFARKLGISSNVSRVIFLLLTLMTSGAFSITYLIAFLLIPQEPINS
ncbi:MAG: PspC domain-containing protein [Candidatus Thalassarchaeaceae archaeon]|nr:PspC domain-containing protein [Candidatus Thalassarchaeaceae archaeon]